ncbi:hypothetical protein [Citrobacter koseri]|uniref:hypothetical protein n=1 Tax=Citrobacter koseri TaxID=545 RepID=UPI0038924319
MLKHIIPLLVLSGLLTYSVQSVAEERSYHLPKGEYVDVVYTAKVFKQEDPNCDSVPAVGVYDKTSILANPTDTTQVLTLTKKSKDWYDYPIILDNYKKVYVDQDSINGSISGTVLKGFILMLFKDGVHLKVYLNSYHINIDKTLNYPLFFSGKAHKKYIVKDGQIVRLETLTCYMEHGKTYKDIFIIDTEDQHPKQLNIQFRTL